VSAAAGLVCRYVCTYEINLITQGIVVLNNDVEERERDDTERHHAVRLRLLRPRHGVGGDHHARNTPRNTPNTGAEKGIR
jgi:hypothetical protein